jgi:uncharacterized protein (TIGR02271 family)
MISESNYGSVVGSTAYSVDGDKIGKVGQLFLDDGTNRPEFATVNTGLFGTSESFVPVANASLDGDRLVVPFTKDAVKDAPKVDLDGNHLDRDEEDRLYDYYGMDRTRPDGYAGGDVTDVSTGKGRARRGKREAGRDTSGRDTDDAMTRSEEHVSVGTASQEAGRARLRKYVTVEEETHTIPVRKEKAVIEREPITEANAGAAESGPEISEEEHEVVLREERPVVEKTTKPVERVRLGTEATTEEQTVTEEVRKERIEAEGDVSDRGRR